MKRNSFESAGHLLASEFTNCDGNPNEKYFQCTELYDRFNKKGFFLVHLFTPNFTKPLSIFVGFLTLGDLINVFFNDRFPPSNFQDINYPPSERKDLLDEIL